MVSTPTIGDSVPLNLVVPRNADTRFFVEWWEDEDRTIPMAVASATGYILESDLEDAPIILDLTPLSSAEGNVVEVIIPKATADGLDLLEGGWWELILVGSDGISTRMLSGNARIIAKAGA